MNCIIIDDEPIARMGMEDLIYTDADLNLLRTFKSTVGVQQYLTDHIVDLIFLDIEMPGVNGLEFAASIPERTLVIFTTAYSQYALQSYEVDAIDYLVKPIDPKRFSKAIEKANSYSKLLDNYKASIQNATKDYVIIRVDRLNHKIFYTDITYIEALKDYVIIYTANDRYITWMNLKTIHSKLPQDRFLRVSKSYVVNNQAITSFNNNVLFINDIEITIGKAYRDSFSEKNDNRY